MKYINLFFVITWYSHLGGMDPGHDGLRIFKDLVFPEEESFAQPTGEPCKEPTQAMCDRFLAAYERAPQNWNPPFTIIHDEKQPHLLALCNKDGVILHTFLISEFEFKDPCGRRDSVMSLEMFLRQNRKNYELAVRAQLETLKLKKEEAKV